MKAAQARLGSCGEQLTCSAMASVPLHPFKVVITHSPWQVLTGSSSDTQICTEVDLSICVPRQVSQVVGPDA